MNSARGIKQDRVTCSLYFGNRVSVPWCKHCQCCGFMQRIASICFVQPEAFGVVFGEWQKPSMKKPSSRLRPLLSLSLPFVSSAHTGMHHAAYASVLSSLSTPDLQRTFCIASRPIRDPPPAAAPYSFEPVRPFTASASTHGELSTPSCFPIWVEHSSLRSIILLHTDASDNNNNFWTHWPR